MIFKAQKIRLKFEFENAQITYEDVIYSASFETDVYVDTTVNFVLEVNYGYTFKNMSFVPENSTNIGLLDYVTTENLITGTFTKFTSGGKIVIELEKNTYSLEIIYGEYDERTNKIDINANKNANLLVNGTESAFKTYTYEYLTNISLTASNFAYGFKLRSWKQYKSGEFIDITDKLFGDGVDFKIQENITICLIVERQSYSVTYKAGTGGYVVDANGFNVLSFVEHVYYGRQVKGTKAVADTCTKFVGWYNDETLVQTDETFVPTSVTADIVYTAKFKGDNILVKLTINTNTKRDGLMLTDDMINTLISIVDAEPNVNISTDLDEYGNQRINALITGFLVNDKLNLNLNIPEWFEIYNANGMIISNNSLTVDKLYPSILDSGNIAVNYVINLKVKTYKITIKTNLDNVVSGVLVHDAGCVGLISSRILDEDKNLVEFTVEYGGSIDVSFTYVAGYMLNNVRYQYDTQTISLGKEFVFDLNRAKMENIKADTVAIFEFAISKYKVTFNFNYKGTNYSDSNIYTYYILHGESKFTDASGNIATLPNTVIDPASGTTEAITFVGWNNNISGLGQYTYLFESDGRVYRMIGDQKIYGFEYDLISYTTIGAIEVTLYGTWSYDKYRVDVEFAPLNIGDNQELKDLFANTNGFYPYYDDSIPRECQYVTFSVGSDVNIIAPEISGYTYYGWKLKDDSGEISKGNSSFEMPAKAITVVLYYAFEIRVEVEEPVVGKNKAFVNDSSLAEVVLGESVELKAYAEKGYRFIGWKVDGIYDDSLTQNAVVVANKSCTYTAVFGFKGVTVKIENTDYVTLSANKNELLLGETLIINVENLQDGYKIDTLTINNVANLFTRSADKTYYYHIITIDDVENGTITIRPVTATKTVKVLFTLNGLESGKIYVNGTDATDKELDLNFNMELTINSEPSARMGLEKVLVNGIEIKNKTDLNINNFALKILADNHFVVEDGAKNTITFIFEKIYWINTIEEFNGEGTADNPYLIFNAEQLAYMASEINSGRWDQSTKKYYKLMANLDLSQKFWTPIGAKEYPFNGAFILNSHTITGVFLDPDVEYPDEALAWKTKLYGVFGYVTEDAELIFEVSRLPIILIISGSVLFILILAGILIIVFYKKNKKIQKLSKKISTDTIGDTSSNGKANVEEIDIGTNDVNQNDKLNKSELKTLEKMLDEEDVNLSAEEIQKKAVKHKPAKKTIPSKTTTKEQKKVEDLKTDKAETDKSVKASQDSNQSQEKEKGNDAGKTTNEAKPKKIPVIKKAEDKVLDAKPPIKKQPQKPKKD